MIFEIPTGIHVLEMLFEEPQSHAVQLLRKHGIDRDQVSQFRVRMDRVRFGAQEAGNRKAPRRSDASEALSHAKTALQRCVVNLNERAREGAVDPLVGRQDEMNQIIRTLGRRRKNNVVLVGEAGVGKTALAEGLAWKIVQGDIPKALASSTVLSLNIGNLVAGTRFRGDFEERMKNFLSGLRKRPDTILFIDEIHMLVGAGSASGMAMDAADQLKPLLAAGELRCIGATTHREFRQIFEQDSALARRFRHIEVEEPSIEETYRILEGLKESYENHHQVVYGAEVIRAIVDLSSKYLHDRRLPDKAVDLLDETGSGCRLAQKDPAPYRVRVEDVEHTVAAVARVPRTKRQCFCGAGVDGPGSEAQGRGLRAGRSHRPVGPGDQGVAGKPEAGTSSDGGVPVQRPDRGRQDGSLPAAGGCDGRRVAAFRHVGVHGATLGGTADRGAAGLCRL